MPSSPLWAEARRLRSCPKRELAYHPATMAIRAALFDMDGTIWDSPIDWQQVRQAIGLPRDGRPIAEHLLAMPPEERARGIQILEHYEALGVELGRPMAGGEELVQLLRRLNVTCILITNNSQRSARAVLDRHPLPFDRVVTRDDGVMKPDPEAFARPLRELGVLPGEAVAIGDSHLDLLTAHRAGIAQIVLVAPRGWVRELFVKDVAFWEAEDLAEVAGILLRLLS